MWCLTTTQSNACQVKPGWLCAGASTWNQLPFSGIPTPTGQRNKHKPKCKHSLTFIGLNHIKAVFFPMHPFGLIIIWTSLCFTILDFLSVTLWLGLGDMLSFQAVPANSSLLWGKAKIRDPETLIPGGFDIGWSQLGRKSLILVRGNKFMTSGSLHPRLVMQMHPQRGFQDTPPAQPFHVGCVRDLGTEQPHHLPWGWTGRNMGTNLVEEEAGKYVLYEWQWNY